MLESSNDEEIISRLPALQAGIVMDMCPHGMAFAVALRQSGDDRRQDGEGGRLPGESTSGRGYLCAQSDPGRDGNVRKRRHSTFTSVFGDQAQGRIRVGKFVERSRKSLVIVGGRTGDRVVTADFVDDLLTCSLDTPTQLWPRCVTTPSRR